MNNTKQNILKNCMTINVNIHNNNKNLMKTKNKNKIMNRPLK